MAPAVVVRIAVVADHHRGYTQEAVRWLFPPLETGHSSAAVEVPVQEEDLETSAVAVVALEVAGAGCHTVPGTVAELVDRLPVVAVEAVLPLVAVA